MTALPPDNDNSRTEIGHLRQHSIRALGLVVDALEAAARQKRSLQADIRTARETLQGLVDERELVEAALIAVRAQLDEERTELEVTRGQRASIPREVVEPAVVDPKGHAKVRPILLIVSRLATSLLIALLFAMAVLLTPLTQVFGGLQLLAVTSGSMDPGIPMGGVVAVRPVPASELQIGDAITFANLSSPDVLITHRIVSLEQRDGQTMLTTKGDANKSVDALSAPAGRAVGRVEFALPRLGDLMVWLASPAVKIGIVSLAVLSLGLRLASIQRSIGASPGLQAARVPLLNRVGRRKQAFIEMQGVPALDSDRVLALLNGGNRALEAGQGRVANQAANGALELDPRSPDAWILKARAAELQAYVTRVRAA